MRLHVVEGNDLSSVGVQGGLGTKHISIFVYCAGERLKKERIRRIQQILERLSKENEEEAEDTVEEIFANLVRFIDSSQQTFQAGGLQPKKRSKPVLRDKIRGENHQGQEEIPKTESEETEDETVLEKDSEEVRH